jgi:hypothetical protein
MATGINGANEIVAEACVIAQYRLPVRLHRAFRDFAHRSGKSMSEIVRAHIERDVKEQTAA